MTAYSLKAKRQAGYLDEPSGRSTSRRVALATTGTQEADYFDERSGRSTSRRANSVPTEACLNVKPCRYLGRAVPCPTEVALATTGTQEADDFALKARSTFGRFCLPQQVFFALKAKRQSRAEEAAEPITWTSRREHE